MAVFPWKDLINFKLLDLSIYLKFSQKKTLNLSSRWTKMVEIGGGLALNPIGKVKNDRLLSSLAIGPI